MRPVEHPDPDLLDDAGDLQSVLVQDPGQDQVRVVQVALVQQEVAVPGDMAVASCVPFSLVRLQFVVGCF